MHMQTVTETAIQKAERGIFTREQVAFWINSRGASLDALLKRAVASAEVRRICRGLYCLSSRFTSRQINPMELAQQIHGPSYISLETALSYHGWIPEAVHAITSVSPKRSRTFETPLGLFSFTCVPQSNLLAAVNRISEAGGGSFFVATPLKSLADYVYTHHGDWTGIAPLRESLRIDDENLAGLTGGDFDELLPVYRSGRVRRFLVGLRKELGR